LTDVSELNIKYAKDNKFLNSLFKKKVIPTNS